MAFVAAVPAIEWNAIGGADLANAVRLGYFTILALGSVYLGVRRQDLGDASPVSGRNAALAPLFAGAVLGGLYFLIKYSTLNPALLYQFFGCLFALLATSEVLQPFLGLALSGNLLDEEALSDEQETDMMSRGSPAALAIAACLVVGYLQGNTGADPPGTLPLTTFAALNNLLGWGITMGSLGVIALESFAAAAFLLVGLFGYDAFFVFKSDIMVTVATQVEAPAKFLFAAMRESGDTRYPFSILGLGDVVVPGAFISLMREVDRGAVARVPARARPRAPPKGVVVGESKGKAELDRGDRGWDSNRYFYSGIASYGAGLLLCFAANYITKTGQPALVYIVPSLLITACGLASSRGELAQLTAFESPRAAAAKEAMARRKQEANK
jgi:minor histocompatibility antigen H13